MGYVHITELRANMAKHFDKLEEDRDHLIVTRQGKPPVVILPLSEYEGLMETLHLGSSPANAAFLRESIAQAEAGNFITVDPTTMKPKT
jgi:antitoxin YefM